MSERQNFDELFDLMQQAINNAKRYPKFVEEAEKLEASLYETHDQLLGALVLVGHDKDKLAETAGLRAFNHTYLQIVAMGNRLEQFLRRGLP